MRLHFFIGGYDYRKTARLRQNIHFNITQVLFADHMPSTRQLISEGEKNVALT